MKAKLTEGELLIARGINMLMRASFAPSNQEQATKHYVQLKDDIGPWFQDYADSVAHTLEDAPAGGPIERD